MLPRILRRSAVAAMAVAVFVLVAGCTDGALISPPTGASISTSVSAPTTPTTRITSGHPRQPAAAPAPTNGGSTPKLNGEAGRGELPSCAHPAVDWNQVAPSAKSDSQGYASVDSAGAGTDIALYLSTSARRYRVEAYRMGYYGTSVPACQVWISSWITGRIQPPAVVVGTVNEPRAPWTPTLTVNTTGWAPGDYLFRIDGGIPALRQFIPLTVRSASFQGRVVIVMPDTTWQAYNSWGGHSLYYGYTRSHHSFANRARIVTFDRPYNWGFGAGEFIAGQLPLVVLAEKLHLPVGYATDVDLQRDPAAFLQARLIVSAGHDEYYSPGMRETLTAARDHGVNLAFFGANDIYRKIRFTDTGIGPDRAVINYKNASDPIGVPDLVTTQWRDPPSDDPESSLTGDDYRCATPVNAPVVVVDSGSWIFAGTGLADGAKLPKIAGQEYDGIDTSRPIPRPLTILFHSPETCHGRATTQDGTYYTTRSGAGVLDVGAYYWDCALANSCPVPIDARTTALVIRITTTFLTAGAAGPLGKIQQAVDNVRTYYPQAKALSR